MNHLQQILCLVLVAVATRSFVSTAAIENATPSSANKVNALAAVAPPQQQQQDDVAQLESLKDATKSTPAKQSAAAAKLPADLVAKRLTHAAFPSASQPLVGPRSLDVVAREMGVTPMQLAEYVFWTGDERGVSLAIQEFLQQGLISREEAVTFLREIRQSISILQNYYAERKAEQQEVEQEALERAAALQEALAISRLRQEQQKQQQLQESKAMNEEEYSDLLQHLKDSDAQFTEYSLEEVIYQLAKMLFSQNLVTGNGQAEAQKVMKKFSAFLKEEKSQMPQQLQRKVFEVLSAALVDAMREQPLTDAAVSTAAPAKKPSRKT